MPLRRIAALGAVASIAVECSRPAPANPTLPSNAPTFAVTCSSPSVIAGDLAICTATAGVENVSTAAVWTSSDPKIATSQGIGLFVGKADGQAVLTAAYSGQSASAQLLVHLQDVLRATASADQGTFKVGTTVTLWLQGFYGVASADSGTLTLVVTDQAGATVSTSTPLVVSHGGDRYLISTSFTLPPGTTRVCRMGVLQIGSTTFTVVPDASLIPCFAVTP